MMAIFASDMQELAPMSDCRCVDGAGDFCYRPSILAPSLAVATAAGFWRRRRACRCSRARPAADIAHYVSAFDDELLLSRHRSRMAAAADGYRLDVGVASLQRERLLDLPLYFCHFKRRSFFDGYGLCRAII